jgi:hypothetical protein
MGIFGSTDKVWVVMFFGVESVLAGGFEVERGIAVSMLEAVRAGLGCTVSLLLTGMEGNVSGSSRVKDVRESCTAGEVPGLYDPSSVFFGALKIILMVGKSGVVFSEGAGL